ncbi:pyruvate ferredoxin oxidoreductase [candidate division KSB1 bacterium]|nr:pyruvate ferredoxin oxidoreductase [candidate division KSB1 bacterium]
MSKILAVSGNEAVAEAMRQINPDVVAAYPITPQTELMHKFAEYHSDGAVNTELVLVESEHSAMSATVGAAAAGARAMTATSANGLALMWEIVYIAASLRLPIIMPVINRALSGPINIHCDHSDTMGARDSGWIQIFSESSQEAYDNTVMAPRIAENKGILLPVMVTLDGFILSHTLERVEIVDDELVQKLIGKYQPVHSLLDVNHPKTYGALDLQDYYFEHKRQQVDGMSRVLPIVEAVAREYEKISGRYYGLIEAYKMEDAERAVIVMGSTVGTTKVTVDELRAKGEKVGMIKIRVYRPFPYEALITALQNVKAVAVLDRAISFGTHGGPVYSDVRAALYGTNKFLPVINFIYGLGGRDVDIEQITHAFETLKTVVKTGKAPFEAQFLGLRD